MVNEIPKEEAPNFWAWTKSIPQPHFVPPTGQTTAQTIYNKEGDTSKGVALKGLGDIVGSAAKGADAYLSTYTQDITRKGAEAIRDQALSESAGTLASMQAGGQAPPGLLGDEEGDSPIAAKTRAGLEPIQSAVQAGKVPDAYGNMRMLSFVKDMRSQTPSGYWGDIDNTVKSVIGHDPANAVLAANVKAINSMLTRAQKDVDKVNNNLDDMAKGGDQNAAAILNARKSGAGISDADARTWIANRNHSKWQEEQNKNEINLRMQEEQLGQGDLGVLKSSVERESVQYAINRNKEYYDTRQLLLDASGHKLNLEDPNDKAEYARRLHQKEVEYRAEMARRGAEVIGKDRAGRDRSRIDVMGQTDWENNVVKPGLASMELDKKLVTDTDLQTGTYWRKSFEEATDKAKVGVFADKDIGEIMRKWYGFSQLAGPEWLKDQARAALGTTFTPGIQRYFGVDDVKTGTATSKEPWVASQSFDTAFKAGYRDPNFYNYMLYHKVDGLLHPNTTDELKRSFIDHFYSPTNSGFLDRITPAGQSKVFQDLTQPKATDQVFANGSPEQKRNYVNAAEGWFAQTTGTKVRDLNNLVSATEAPIPLKFGWDDKTHNISVIDDKGRILSLASEREYFDPTGSLNTSYVRQVKETVRNINAGLSNLSHIYKKDPSRTVDEALFDTMNRVGFNIDPTKMTGLPADIVRAIQSARQRSQHVNPETHE